MKTVLLGSSSLRSTRIAYGCWRLAGARNPREVTPDHEARGIRAALAAFEAGYTLFDHADIYGGGRAESIFGQALRQAPGVRDRIAIATKCGIRFSGDPQPASPHRYDFSASHIVRSCEQSLRRLGIEFIDLYQLHRPDYLMDPAEVADAFDQLRRTGKAREFGVSNFTPSQVAALQKACPMRLVSNQVEISLRRLDCLEDGTLDQCLLDRMTPLAWSPLAGGRLLADSNAAPPAASRSAGESLGAAIADIALSHQVSPAVIAIAWLLQHPAGIIPIVGSVQPERILDAVRADTLELGREAWYRLLLAARGTDLP